MTEGDEVGTPFLRRSQYLLSSGRFSAAKKLVSEDHTFISLGSVAPVGSGKLSSLLKTQKTLSILGWFHTDFLPEVVIFNFNHPYNISNPNE
jgi:hypothetical protein